MKKNRGEEAEKFLFRFFLGIRPVFAVCCLGRKDRDLTTESTDTGALMKRLPLLKCAAGIFVSVAVIVVFFNIFSRFFPVDVELAHDEAEHLHAAWLMSQGDRPFVDFIENHPMLYNHFLGAIRALFSLETARAWAFAARITVAGHFLLFLGVLGLWLTRLLRRRPHGVFWGALLVTALASLHFTDPYFGTIWQFRPDYICHAWTLAGCFLIWKVFVGNKLKMGGGQVLSLALAGGLIGVGNAVLPKGMILIGAFALTWAAAELLKKDDPFWEWLTLKNFLGIGIAGVFCLLFFAGFVLLDCHLSGITVEHWISGVIRINGQRHLVPTLVEENPITHFVNLFSLPLPLLIGFLLWAVWEGSRLRHLEEEDPGRQQLWLMAFFVVVLNLLLAPYSNGITWTYYFIPSFFACAVLCLLLYVRVGDTIGQKGIKFKNPVALLGLAAVLLYISARLIGQPLEMADQIRDRHVARGEVQVYCPADFNQDQHLPRDFIYLVYSAYRMPVMSRQWNFYYMLWENQGFWNDCKRFGIGPNPSQDWARERFVQNPPDAALFSSYMELYRVISSVFECHHIDVSWLKEELEKGFVPVQKKQLKMLVRRDRLETLLKVGWKVMPRLPLTPFFGA